MPKYHYKCERCGADFEIIQKHTDPKLTVCNKCHDNTLYRVLGEGVGMRFKGRGFFTTDKDYDALDKDLYDHRHLL